ncbi:MAG: sortase [Oscillospiraceae bacterium]|nr:sortase [Oscillospiraceae bacterium]
MAILLSVTVYGLDFYGDYKIYSDNLRTNQILREHMEEAEKIKTKQNKTEHEPQEQEEDYIQLHQDDEPYNPGLIEIDGEFYLGILSIPVLNLELPVNNEWSDEKLNVSPCRYSGDFTEQLVICSHDYKFHFANISKLAAGDIAVLTDALGKEHIYSAELTEIIAGNDIDGMVESAYELTLFTCARGGTDRVAVRCRKI